MLRPIAIALILVLSVGIMLPFANSAHGVRQTVQVGQRRHHRYRSRAWWRRYRARLRQKRLAAEFAAHRNATLSLPQNLSVADLQGLNGPQLPSLPSNSAATATADWQEHVDGKPQFAPPILPLAPAKFTGALYIVTGSKPAPECVSFSTSLTNSTGSYVQTVVPNGAGTTSGMLGYMFWAAECPATRRICTVPPNSCEGGVGVGATTYGIPIPMPPLRQN